MFPLLETISAWVLWEKRSTTNPIMLGYLLYLIYLNGWHQNDACAKFDKFFYWWEKFLGTCLYIKMLLQHQLSHFSI